MTGQGSALLAPMPLSHPYRSGVCSTGGTWIYVVPSRLQQRATPMPWWPWKLTARCWSWHHSRARLRITRQQPSLTWCSAGMEHVLRYAQTEVLSGMLSSQISSVTAWCITGLPQQIIHRQTGLLRGAYNQSSAPSASV